MKQLKIDKSITVRDEKCIEKYFNDVNKVKVITAEEEIELAKKIKKGDQAAADKLVKANLRFVVSVAKKYQNNGLELSDLISEGNVGLIKAAHKFDETRGFKFISFAVWWIRQSIIQAIAEKRRVIRVPSNKNLQSIQFNRILSDLTQTLERNPTALEIAEKMNLSEDEVSELYLISSKTSSLNKKLSDTEDSSTLEDLLTDDDFSKPNDSLIHESLKDDVERALSSLSSKEVRVLKCLYGIGCKQKSKEMIAIEMDYTPERIRQISKAATEKLSKNEKAKNLLLKYM